MSGKPLSEHPAYHPLLAQKVRKIASRGRMDDADVQVVFDAADMLDALFEYHKGESNE